MTKIYVLNIRTIALYFLILIFVIALISFISLTGLNAIEAVSADRELPVYSVDYAGKKLALTFDCAWVAVP